MSKQQSVHIFEDYNMVLDNDVIECYSNNRWRIWPTLMVDSVGTPQQKVH